MPPAEFYERMKNGELPQSQANNPAVIEDKFRAILDKGLDIIHIAFSSALSGSYNNVCMVANELREEYTDAKITVIDSMNVSLGETIMLLHATELKEKGLSYEDIVSDLEEYKNHINVQFTVDDLFHLHRGGRVSKATAIIGTLINVKPVLHVDNEGHLTSVCNVRGRKKALLKLVELMGEQIDGYQNDIVFISHGDCLEDAEFVAAQVKERFGIQNFLIDYVSPTIGAHSGPGTVALFYLGNTR